MLRERQPGICRVLRIVRAWMGHCSCHLLCVFVDGEEICVVVGGDRTGNRRFDTENEDQGKCNAKKKLREWNIDGKKKRMVNVRKETEEKLCIIMEN